MLVQVVSSKSEKHCVAGRRGGAPSSTDRVKCFVVGNKSSKSPNRCFSRPKKEAKSGASSSDPPPFFFNLLIFLFVEFVFVPLLLTLSQLLSTMTGHCKVYLLTQLLSVPHS